MVRPSPVHCPECDQPSHQPANFDRRQFIRMVGGGVAAIAATQSVLTAGVCRANPEAARTAKPAEALIRELYTTLSPDQKTQLVLPWNHGAENGAGIPTRMRMYNGPINGKRIGEAYTKPQQELNERILRAICSDDEGYSRISRNNKFDNSGSMNGCGAIIFGEPSDDKKFAWVFAGHHLTVRCDGNSEEGAAFGGPMYYGHSVHGYSPNNVFHYQTQGVLSVFDALNEEQRKRAIAPGSPGEHEGSIRFRPADQATPGIGYGELSKDQRDLVEKVMRDVLSPYRTEDADEVMQIVKANGGLEKLHLAFYQDKGMNDNERWHFWRLEGPGFVWNYRVLPHVHTYVNISIKLT